MSRVVIGSIGVIFYLAVSFARAETICLKTMSQFARGLSPGATIFERVSWRSFKGTFLQQEHEGDLRGSLATGGRGAKTVFAYYRPVNFRAEIAEKMISTMNWAERTMFKINMFFQKDIWRAFSLKRKLLYLVSAEKIIAAEKGTDSVWDRRVYLLLEKTHNAPAYLAEHPSFEAAPETHLNHPAARFLLPEIVTAKEKPVTTINDAIARAKHLTENTNHGGIHFHVFFKLPHEMARAQVEALDKIGHFINDGILFEALARNGRQNIARPAMLPWHSGRTQTLSELIENGSKDPNQPEPRNVNNEKTVPMAIRYWGKQEGDLVLSFELRGITPEPKNAGQVRIVAPLGDTFPESNKGSFERMQKYLAFLQLCAHRIVEGKTLDFDYVKRDLDANKVDDFINEVAKAHGYKAGQYLTLSEFAKALTENGMDLLWGNDNRIVHPVLLMPFLELQTHPQTAGRFALRFIELSVQVAALAKKGRLDYAVTHYYDFSTIYRDWATTKVPEFQSRFNELIKQLAQDAGV